MNKRDLIIGAAEELFGEKGIFDTHIIDIANQLKISKKTIYKYFESKDEIVLVIFKERMDFFNHSIEAIYQADKCFLKRIIDFISFIRQNLRGVTKKYVRDISDFSPMINEWIENYINNAAFIRFRNFLDSGKRDNYLKQNINIDSTMLLYRDAIKNYVALLDEEEWPESIRNAVPVEILCESFITIFRGILNNEAEKEFDYLLKDNTF